MILARTGDPNRLLFRYILYRATDQGVFGTWPISLGGLKMFPCPHCGKTIEVEPPLKVRWWEYDSGRGNVSLGCGTFILIAIIVSIFSRAGDPTDDIRKLRKDIQALEQKIDNIPLKPVAVPQADEE